MVIAERETDIAKMIVICHMALVVGMLDILNCTAFLSSLAWTLDMHG
jgi:hypothetical protein